MKWIFYLKHIMNYNTNKMKLSLIIVNIIICLNAFSQTEIIKGYVKPDKSNTLDYFNAVLLDTKDSSFIKGAVFYENTFYFDKMEKRDYLILLSSLGYNSLYYYIDKEHLILKDTLVLTLSTLKEVVVSGSIPLIENKKGNIVVNIGNSSLSEAGSAIDVLKKSPSVVFNNQNSIQIIGKGTPIIFIDDKEVISNDELNGLQSSDILSITINKNASSEYSANAHSVINIKTKTFQKESFNFLIFNNFTKSRSFGDNAGFQINNKNKKSRNYFKYTIDNTERKDITINEETIVLPLKVVHNYGNETSNYGYLTHRFFIGTDYYINSKNIVGYQYSGSFNRNYEKNNTLETVTDTVNVYREINSNDKGNKYFHNFNINFKSNIDSVSYFKTSIDYALQSKRNLIDVFEKNINSNTTMFSNIDNNSKYNIYSAIIDYNFKLFKNIESKVGAKLSSINLNSKISGNIDFNSETKLKDNIYAIYLSLEKNIRKLNIYVGVRSENTKSFVHLNKSVSALIDTNYISLYPSLKFNYEKSQNLNFDLTYSRRITRPEFRQVNPEITYFDSLSYKIGNPLLVPTFSDNIDASINLYNIVTLSAGYQFKHNSIIEIAESNNNIIKYTFINLPESKMLTSSIDINYSKKWFSGNINLSVEKPHVKIKYLNSSKLLSKPTWYFSLNNDIKLFKKIVFNYSFNYQSSGNYEISYFNEKYNLSFSIYRKFIKNQLTVSLIANDVLNTDDTKWFDKYSNITSKIYPDLDYTYIRLSIKFNFNNFKSGFKENFGNSDELNRI